MRKSDTLCVHCRANAGQTAPELLSFGYGPVSWENSVMRYLALASDYDGTLAEHGKVTWESFAVRFNGACHQQGLLHLFHLSCAGRHCERCPARAGPDQ